VSRTIRRTKVKKFYSKFEKEYTYIYPTEWKGIKFTISNKGAFPLIPQQGKFFSIAYWKYHSDVGYKNFKYEKFYELPIKEPESATRTKYNLEIYKWLKNNNYEIIFQKSKKILEYY
jgi:hypothetical protein